MLSKEQREELRRRHADRRRREEAAKSERRREKRARTARLKAAEARAIESHHRERSAERLHTFHQETPPGGLAAARSPKGAPPENKVIEPGEDKAVWPLRMPPATYLALHPEGQWADLAREIVGE
jgi:hypothetical protein